MVIDDFNIGWYVTQAVIQPRSDTTNKTGKLIH